MRFWLIIMVPHRFKSTKSCFFVSVAVSRNDNLRSIEQWYRKWNSKYSQKFFGRIVSVMYHFCKLYILRFADIFRLIRLQELKIQRTSHLSYELDLGQICSYCDNLHIVIKSLNEHDLNANVFEITCFY